MEACYSIGGRSSVVDPILCSAWYVCVFFVPAIRLFCFFITTFCACPTCVCSVFVVVRYLLRTCLDVLFCSIVCAVLYCFTVGIYVFAFQWFVSIVAMKAIPTSDR